MNRILCIHLPNWSVQRIVAARPELKGQPIVLYAHLHPRGQRVVACSEEAGRHGVRIGMPLAEAETMLERGEVRRQGAGGRGQETAAGSHPRGAPVNSVRVPRSSHSAFRIPHSAFETHDPIADREALVELARWSERFSPLLGLEDAVEPTDLLLDITGLAPLFGSEEQLACLVAKSFQSRGYRVRIAIADTIGAAWAMAHFGESRKSEIGMRNDGGMRKSEVGSRNEEEENSKINPIFRIPHSDFRILSDLPVAALRLPDKTVALLAELGIERIGQLVALPRESLSSRFGDGLALRIDQAEGLVNEVIVAERPVEGFCAEWALEYPTHNRKAIEMIVARLIERVARRLVDCNQGVVQLECRLVCGKQPLRISVGLFEPTAMTSHLMQLMRMQLERLKLPQPVQAVNVQAITTSRLEQKQNELFAGDSRQRPRQLTALVDRLSSRLGRHAVVRPRSLDDPLPERSWRYVPLTGQSRPRRAKAATRARRPKTPASKHGRPSTRSKRQRELTAADRPLRLHRLPLPLEVMAVVPDGPPVHFTLQNRQHVIARHWGPERIETGWWRGTSVRRDYYRVETASGHRFWLFRRLDDGKWFLHGEFE